MVEPRRRRKDQMDATSEVAAVAHVPSGGTAQTWIEHCVVLIRQADPQLSVDEATELAHHLLAFERTGVMSPERAVAFVVSQFDKGIPVRLERRTRTT